MATYTQLERLNRRVPEADVALLCALLEDAEDAILAYTRRERLPRALEFAKVQLATIYYNRMGAEGETGRSEGGVSRTMQEMPESVAAQLRPYRLAKVVKMVAAEGAQ